MTDAEVGEAWRYFYDKKEFPSEYRDPMLELIRKLVIERQNNIHHKVEDWYAVTDNEVERAALVSFGIPEKEYR